ncbi:MAG: ABC transporter substrate-binding protein [Ginsengibacter sp.]
MKKLFFVFAAILFFNGNQNLFAQNTFKSQQKTFRVGVFAPLYLDSVFEYSQLRSEKTIPKFIMPSVDFVQGAEIAFDSLGLKNDHVEVFIYDTRSFLQPIPWLIQNKLLDSIDLIIGSVKDVDFKDLSDFSAKRNIPFISATYPNDGGITDNPNMVILNSTLKAHCEGIYSYILQNHGTDKVIILKQRGAQEDKIVSTFKMLNEQEGKPLLNIQTIHIDSTISTYLLKSRLDSTKNNVIIAGSLDEAFAKKVTDACFAIHKTYPIILIGMPNWDGFKIFSVKNAYKDFPVHFTTPYYNSKTSLYNTMLTTEYYTRYKARPSDMAYKGFETAYMFTNLLVKYPGDLLSHINDRSQIIFSEYNFRPVYFKKNSQNADYIENKHLYIMRIFNGAVTREW